MTVLILSACGSGTAVEERVEARRDELSAAERISFTADVTANLGDEVFLCTLKCTATPEAVEMEALSPELVAGVRASLAAGETTLRYGGVALSFGTDGLGPFSALPLICEGLTAGHVVRAWTEEGRVAAELYVDDSRTLTLWFDAETMTPVHAELFEDGMLRIRCEIRDFTYD